MPVLTLTTNTHPASDGLQSLSRGEEGAVKRCSFREKTGLSLEECIAFCAKTFEENTEWIGNITLLSLLH